MQHDVLLAHLEKLGAYATVIACGSVRSAARELRLTQPALSRTVATLEAALDVQLMVRTASGVTPTPEGAALLAFSHHVQHLAIQAAAQISALSHKGKPVGTLRCVCHEVIAGYLWPVAIARAAHLAPKLELRLETMCSAKEMMRVLGEGKADIALGAQLPAGRGMQVLPIYSDTYALFTHGKNIIPKLKAVADVPKNTLLYVPESIAGEDLQLAAALRDLAYVSPSKYTIASYEALLSMAVAGLGTAVLPRRPFRQQVDAGLLTEQLVDGKSAAIGGYQVVCAYRQANGTAAVFAAEQIFQKIEAELK